ncbi:MAG: hypothetical protein NTV58_05835 [Deltaproteobacteria bacterium]|nr:hypothetical protein [Deltaproteobacteria bacterium]
MNCHKRIFTLIILITVIIWGGMAGVSLAAENRGHGAPADALPKELKNVSVKDYFLPGKTKEAGVVQTAGKRRQTLRAGRRLHVEGLPMPHQAP